MSSFSDEANHKQRDVEFMETFFINYFSDEGIANQPQLVFKEMASHNLVGVSFITPPNTSRQVMYLGAFPIERKHVVQAWNNALKRYSAAVKELMK